ncbi:Mg/Co/Ni transporter, MgtE family [Campylobacter pinnipediorum subsp. caledonicus]|uniref:Magnesium transporter MgtE n=1 Tax=Campylobacter pinnipediorum subsp. caledonicus TaxID=1874362 RepID=A0A1S6U5S7_9BACT|nr:magnesium transporter [Campylobacter pinnipediorum]AQW85506.1 Mg/Co/Ni transporter, MgtE family [Campylobacter pinnipediorum subsp. caledonicus]AQW87063.1 Mg/Co/Ni transporter, MgtE family [Campylobacter pinnipediorum subsp. caledonicus]OPA72679.1 magnesium transporter [Campylobacter pinnipediorum subsp. caledonicus]
MNTDDIEEVQKVLDLYLKQDLENELSAYDIAQHLKALKYHDEDTYTSYLARLKTDVLGDVAIELPESLLKDVIENISTDKMVEALEELESDDQTDLLQYIKDIDEDKAKEIFDGLDKEDQADVLRLGSYSDDESGAYMQTELFWAYADEKLGDAVTRLREQKNAGELENISQLFIVNNDKILKYTIPLEELILFDFSKKLQQIIQEHEPDYYSPYAALDTQDIKDTVALVQEYDLNVIAVVDSKGILLGRITADDIHDFIQESATEQIYNLAGLNDEAEEEDTLAKAGKARAIWLFINLFTAILSSSIIGIFDETIASYVALAVLMPIVASMGGNTGTQALTVTVRRLTLGEIEFKDAKYVLKREVGISIINGIIFGAVMGIVSWLWFDKALLGLVIACSMIVNLSLAGFFGTVIPLTLKRLNIDPAVGSAVLLTTFTDSIGFFSFLGLAKWILI